MGGNARGNAFAEDAMLRGARAEDSQSRCLFLLQNCRQHVPMVAALDETTDDEAKQQSFDGDRASLHELRCFDFYFLEMLVPIRGIAVEV